jgi:hypothetical protein
MKGSKEGGLQLQRSEGGGGLKRPPSLLSVGLGSFSLFPTPPFGFLGDPPDLLHSPPLLPVKLVHLSVQRFNLLQFFLLPQRSRTEVCSFSCRQARFLVAFRSGYLNLLPRQIRLMWCALGARGSNSAAVSPCSDPRL